MTMKGDSVGERAMAVILLGIVNLFRRGSPR